MNLGSFNKNVFFSYSSQLYVALIGIFVLPVFVKYLGDESYGLIAFFAMLQTWFNFLDLGLTPTISREAARYRSGLYDEVQFTSIFKVVTGFFLTTAIIGSFAIYLMRYDIADNWLKYEILSRHDVVYCIELMSVVLGLRWVSGLYKSLINGFESILWLSAFNFVSATMRFVFSIPLVVIFNFNIVHFFVFQFVISLLEIAALIMKSTGYFSKFFTQKFKCKIADIKNILKFSLVLALTSSIWVLTTQADKFILSGMLGLGDYAHYSLAVTAASVIMVASTPISQTLLPRLSFLQAANNLDDFRLSFFNSHKLIVKICGCLWVFTFVYSEFIIRAWTQDESLVENVSNIFQMYSTGNFVLALNSFLYYYLYAVGKVKYHFFGSVFFLALLITTLYVFVPVYGSIGAGMSWLISNVVYFLFIVIPVLYRNVGFGYIREITINSFIPLFLVFFAEMALKVITSHFFVKVIFIQYLYLLFSVVSIYFLFVATQKIQKKLLNEQ